MTVAEVRALFRSFTDEEDLTWLTEANVTTALRRGYDRLRAYVSTYDPHFYEARVIFTPVGFNHELSGLVFGAAPTALRLSRLIKVAVLQGPLLASGVSYFLRGANSEDELEHLDNAYLLVGTVLRFSFAAAGTFRLHYVPVSAVDFAAGTFIDDLEEYHDLIALLAYAYYGVRDMSENPLVTRLIQERLSELEIYLTHGRSQEARDHVSRHSSGQD